MIKMQLNSLGKAFGERWIFKDICAEFVSGKHYAICGKNGGGKSTFLSIISGFTQPTAGDIKYWKSEAPYRPTAQDFALAAPYLSAFESLTVAENFCLATGLPPKDPKAQAALAEIALSEQANSPLSHLSTGMQQRLLLAIAFAKPSAILLLDEPFSHLDETYQKWCQSCMKRAIQEGRLLIVCHPGKPDAQGADKKLVMTKYSIASFRIFID